MSLNDIVINSVISLVAAGVAVVLALWAEKMRQPNLEITASEDANADVTYTPPHNPVGRWKFFRIMVINKPFPLPFQWIPRYTAESCSADITITKDGTDKESFTMKGRWAGTPEPVGLSNEQKFIKAIFPDPISITLGDGEPLDVIAKPGNDVEAYAWNNDVYYSSNWKTHKLTRGLYTVEVKIKTHNGSKFQKSFELRVADTIEDTYVRNS